MDNNCVLIKKKEYEELKKQADSKKPDHISITLYGGYDRISGKYDGIHSSINLSDGILKQINSIRGILADFYAKKDEKYDRLIFDYKTMGFFKRLFFGFECILDKNGK